MVEPTIKARIVLDDDVGGTAGTGGQGTNRGEQMSLEESKKQTGFLAGIAKFLRIGALIGGSAAAAFGAFKLGEIVTGFSDTTAEASAKKAFPGFAPDADPAARILDGGQVELFDEKTGEVVDIIDERRAIELGILDTEGNIADGMREFERNSKTIGAITAVLGDGFLADVAIATSFKTNLSDMRDNASTVNDLLIALAEQIRDAVRSNRNRRSFTSSFQTASGGSFGTGDQALDVVSFEGRREPIIINPALAPVLYKGVNVTPREGARS